MSPHASSGTQSLIDQTACVYPPLLALVVLSLTALPAGWAALVGVQFDVGEARVVVDDRVRVVVADSGLGSPQLRERWERSPVTA
jgi:hypothetical protein